MASEIVPIGPISVATDASMKIALQLRAGAADEVEAIADERLAASPSVAAAAAAAATAGVSSVIAGYFQPGTQTGLVTFPNGSEPGTVYGAKYAIDPTAITAGTANFNGLPLSTGSGNIVVRSPSGTNGTWGNSLTAGFQRPTAGAGIVMGLADVGLADGASRVTVGGLATDGSALGLGGIVAARFDSGAVSYIRWFVGGSGRYGISRWTGTSLTTGTQTTLVGTDRVHQAGDVLDLALDRVNGFITLKANGSLIGMYQLSAAQLAGHATASFAGMWGNSTAPAGAKLGVWNWMADYTSGSGTVNRQLVSVGTDFKLPSTTVLSAEQKRQAVGPVFDPRDYGAKVDGVYLADASTTAGQNTVHSPSYTFSTADLGKRLYVLGAGPVIANANDGVWIGTIKGISAGDAQLDTFATSAVTGATFFFATLDDQALATAQVECVKAGGGTVLIPKGRMGASIPLPVQNKVTFAGRGWISWVHVIQDSSNDVNPAAGVTDWLTAYPHTEADPLTDSHARDFGINAEAHVHSLGYGAAIKPLNFYNVKRCTVERMYMYKTPATSIPFDKAYDYCVIRDNLVEFPGRLAPSGVGPGGSGIGCGTRANGVLEPTLIEGNIVRGNHTATVAGAGHNGIFTESQIGGSDPDLGTPGYRIVNNVVIAMPFGISDTGSNGTIISGNIVLGCGRGIRYANTTLPGSYSGLGGVLTSNVIMYSTGPGANDGIGVSILTSDPATYVNVREYLNTIVQGNQITDNAKWGISINASNRNLAGVRVSDNQILRNGRSGIRVVAGNGSPAARVKYLAVKDNTIAYNGRALVAGDQAAVLVTSGTTWEGGRVQDNDMYDLATVPTQVDTVSVLGTLVGVRRSGNTGDA